MRHTIQERLSWLNADVDDDIDKLLLVKAEGNLDDDQLNDASEIAADMQGFNPEIHPAWAAARFLAGTSRPRLTLQEMRQLLYDHDGDYESAALASYHLPDNEESRRALKAVIGVAHMVKTEAEYQVPAGKDIVAGTPDAESLVKPFQEAFANGKVRIAHLSGKHSKGSLLVKDDESGNVYLLKPGSGGQSPAKGAGQEPASQSRREAAFWHIADAWGLGHSIPRADLVIIDGEEYAAIRMLPFTYKNFQKKLLDSPSTAQAALAPYRANGILIKWAVLDAVLGNPDRHGMNLMVSNDNSVVALIDHGSAFAGPSFDPAHDRNSFVPYYLRQWAPPKFNKLTTKEKLAVMPKVALATRHELKDWMDSLHADTIAGICTRYGINPQPSVDRLARLKTAVSNGLSVDDAVERFWVAV